MMVKCVKRYACPNKPVTSDGCRFKLYYPNGGTYSGYWLKNQNHGFGVKITPERDASYYANKKQPAGQLIYKGDWKDNRRTNSGTMIRKQGTDLQTIYTGMWYDGKKVGEGKKFYSDGCVYFGEWLRNCRHGMGIQWYGDGSIYLGQWQTDYKHGLGVLFYGRSMTLSPLFSHLSFSLPQLMAIATRDTLRGATRTARASSITCTLVRSRRAFGTTTTRKYQ